MIKDEIIIVKHSKDRPVLVPIKIARDSRLSWGAKGFYVHIAYCGGEIDRNKLNEKERKLLGELVELGYLIENN